MMKSLSFSFLLLLLVICCTMTTMMMTSMVDSFVVKPTTLTTASPTKTIATTTTTSTQLFFFGGPKDDGSPGDYVCLDCGYVFTKGPKAWADLPSNWSCPPCGSIKRRFKKVPKGSAKGTVTVKKTK